MSIISAIYERKTISEEQIYWPRRRQIDKSPPARSPRPPTGRQAPRAKENAEQEALFQWAAISEKSHPELRLLFHIPNGGYRHPREAVAMRRRGVKPGVPDILFPVARHGFHGLWIELKRKGGKASEHQNFWLDALAQEGYAVHLCIGWEAAKRCLEEYLAT